MVGRESNVGGYTHLCGPGESKRKLKKDFDEAIVSDLVQGVWEGSIKFKPVGALQCILWIQLNSIRSLSCLDHEDGHG